MNATAGGQDPHTLAGAYALDAIDDELERRRFEEHMGRCSECAQEIRGLTETVARMGLAAAVEPPPLLRERVMAEIGQVRQLPPVPPALPPAAVSRHDRAGGSRWWPRLVAVVAVAASVAAVAAGTVAIRAQDQLERARQANRDIAMVIAAPDARTTTAPAERGGSGTVIISRSRGGLVFLASGLAALPESRTYQLWQLAPGRIRSAGLLRPDAGGHTVPVVTAPDAGVTKVGVTVEPAGGSAQPTTVPLLLLDVPAT
ncbi:anti-sigma factor [Streptosporangium sp. NPDC004631]